MLPGLYLPSVFRRELERSLALATRLRDRSGDERARLLVTYHQEGGMEAHREWQRLAGTPSLASLAELASETRFEGAVAAQRVTASKMAVEVPRLRAFAKGLAPEAVPEDQIETWSAAGQALYGSSNPVLDDASRALVVRLHNAVPRELRATQTQLDAMIARLERTIVADTALNQLRLRPMIEREIVRLGGRLDFEALNDWIYAAVLQTPKEDVWLGLMPRNVFTGVPGDGVAVRK